MSIEISNLHLQILKQARRTLIFHNEEPWEKVNNANDFDVPIGSYDGAEFCELVGIFLKSELSEVMEKPSYGLYRDDGLGIFRRLGKPDIERRKKRIIQIFKRHGLDITIKANLKIAQYLDVELDLMNNMYRPYRKPNSEPLYINTQSNHPPSVLKQIPKSIQRRLSDISSNADVFNQA